MANLTSHIDSPPSGSLHYRQRILVEGWIFDPDGAHGRLTKIAAYHGADVVGETQILFPRRDVNEALKISITAATGFRFRAVLSATHAAHATIEIKAHFEDGRAVTLGVREVQICNDDRTHAPYGHFCDPAYTTVLHRRHIYSSGKPSHEPSHDCLELLRAYLPARGTVLDVGCGVGAYANGLRESGFQWLGCELAPRCVEVLAANGLPHRRIKRPVLPWRSHRLPARDGEFDAAIAIEVLEHVRAPDQFIAELRRVAKTRALISVPNMEILPILSDQLIAPWHILEKGHRNFFSRSSLLALLSKYFRHVEVIDYGRFPVQSTDGVFLDYHLLAICDV